MKIKICGITNIRDALCACEYGADALGFVFAKSKRKISLRTAASITGKMPPFVSKVGVFVNAQKKDVLRILKTCHLDVLQFHGEESDKYCAFFRKYCKIVKGIRLEHKESLKSVNQYNNIDAYLFDSYSENQYGGTGRSFGYSFIENIVFNKPIIIAGGINVKNFQQVLRLVHPFALDVSSSIEEKPGKKNLRKMKKLIEKVKAFKQ